MLNPKVSPLVFPRLLLTGAAGQLGRELRPRLKAYCDVLRVSDQNDLGMAAVGEKFKQQIWPMHRTCKRCSKM